MNSLQFILRGLKHHRTGYLGVLLGSALGTMVLLGALFAGDSVKSTLRQIAEERIGKTRNVLVGGENLFLAELASEVGPDTAPVLQIQGQVSEPTGRTIGQTDIFGINERFWDFSVSGDKGPAPRISDKAWPINKELSDSLDLGVGDTLIVRLRKPSLVTGDVPLADNDDEIITLRGEVSHILEDGEMGRFSLAQSQLNTPKVFLPLPALAEAMEQLPARANLLLSRDPIDPATFEKRVRSSMSLADYGLSIVDAPENGHLAIRSERIFLSPTLEAKIRATFPRVRPTLTYLVNTLAANERETPYSMVTGADPTLATFVPDDLKDDEIALSSWEAEDLAAQPGDTVRISYYVLGKNNRLTEEHAEFTVRHIYPLEGAAADKQWTPDFPGITEAETNADWSSGLPLDMKRIRDKDETYWDNHRGTPKAFITHTAAAKLWQNRWGSATGLRSAVWDIPQEQIETKLLNVFEPLDAGLHTRDIASESSAAASSPVDIASLFLSMSFFLIVAAVALTAMLFRFNIEQRNTESGLLTAVGIPAKKILRWRLGEGLVMVTLGALLGAVLAFAYTRGLLLFLERIWNSGGERLFQFHASPASVAGGVICFVILMMATIWLVTRKQGKRSASLRLTSGSEEIPPTSHRKRPRLIAIVFALIGVGSLAASSQLGPSSAFFLSGFCFLIAGLALWKSVFQLASRPKSSNHDPTPEPEHKPDRGLQSAPPPKPPNNAAQPPNPSLSTSHFSLSTPAQLAKTNLARRPTRSLVAIGTLASAIFLVISVTSFQKHGAGEWQDPTSGTGGYGVWIETASPLIRQASGQFEFESDDITTLLPVRVGTGDDASCFNLNSVAKPRLLAVDTTQLEGRFSIKSTAEGIEPSWAALRNTPSPSDRELQLAPEPEQETPLRAFIDETTLLWVLKKKPGDLIEYTDEFGTPFTVEIAGTLTESVFQGSFIVDEAAFVERYPSSPGYRIFLATTSKAPAEARADLQRSLTDLGATITPTAERIAAFHSVENTYISIFNVLGGLGVILGSAGLGLVTARNLAERKDEFAMLHTIGISRRITRSIITREVRRLILAALLIGLLAALISILPSLPQQPAPGITLAWIAGLALLTTACATLSAWLAYRSQRT